ncbi:MAG: ABC transporter substrate-binding protein [Desulfarculus sp.]|nr:ABC transporter substrate-binding protein [Desulfarculus sp.]
MKRFAHLLCGLLAICLLTPLSAGAAEPVKLGLLLPITGSNAPYGQNALRGFKLAQEARPTVLGRPVEYVVVDNKSDNIECSNAASRLIQKDKVAAIVGPLSSKNALAAAPLCEAAKVPMISPWATNPLVTQGRKYAFRVCFIDPFQGQVGANYAFNELKARTAALMVDVSQDYCVGISGFFERAFTKLGGKIVLKTMYNTNDQDFSAQLAAIKQAKPDILYVPAYFTEGALIARQARELGVNIPMLGGDASQADELIKIGGEAVEGLAFTTHFDEQGVTTESGKAFVKNYRQLYNEAPDSCSALTYDAYNVLLDAIERQQSLDPEALVKGLEATKDFPGVTGVMTLVAHDAVKPAVILHVDKGKFSFLTTVQP